MQPLIDGDLLDTTDETAVRRAGACLASLHGALAIHKDYRASNVLTADSEILAVIDFDSVVRDYCVSDLANSFVRLGTRFTNWQPTPASVRHTLLEGYQSVRSLTLLERQWLQALVLWQGIAAIPPGDDPAGWARAL
ncbi:MULTISPECIES: phosphotransferase [unclassified Kribbella]|uniref:phosphotransferase n=1 Tax=unclassified Kribbella TaxID=2644121 RepID=UPI00301A295B